MVTPEVKAPTPGVHDAPDRAAALKGLTAPPPERRLRIWARRALTIPGTFLIVGLFVALTPALLLVAGVIDLGQRNEWRRCRFIMAVAILLSLHIVGLVLLFDAFVRGGRWWGAPKSREIRLTARCEAWWAWAMVYTAMWCYSMRLEIDGLEKLSEGPVLMFMQHVSIIDTMLPLGLVGRPFRQHVRYVMKRELLVNPCVDVVGNRIPTAFVRRGGTRSSVELAKVMSLLDNLGPEALVVIYPEGTRFTPEKQARRVAELSRKDPRMAEWAQGLKNVLPPQLGGSLGLLSRSEGVDVAFCAHVGLEGASTIADFAAGAMLFKTLRVKFWRVPAAEVPQGGEARVEWLCAQWTKVDAWVEAQKAPRA